MIWIEEEISGGEEEKWIGHHQEKIFRAGGKIERVAEPGLQIVIDHRVAAEKAARQVGQQKHEKHRGVKNHHRNQFLRVITLVIPHPKEEVGAQKSERA